MEEGDILVLGGKIVGVITSIGWDNVKYTYVSTITDKDLIEKRGGGEYRFYAAVPMAKLYDDGYAIAKQPEKNNKRIQ